MSSNTKPTLRTDRELRALQQAHEYDVTPMPGSGDRWCVRRKDSGRAYQVDVVQGTCSCPDHQNRGSLCKHWSLINLGLILGELKTPEAKPALSRDQRIYRDFGPDAL